MKQQLFIPALILFCLVAFTFPAIGQRGRIRTDSRILYHDGPVMSGQSHVYLIWYGNWAGSMAPIILTDLVSNIGGSSYMTINSTYPDASGFAPSGAIIYSGTVSDSFSEGATLTVGKLQYVVARQVSAGNLPADPRGIYLIIGSPHVTDMRPDGTTFCTPGTSPYHGQVNVNGVLLSYGFLGGANRCPASVGPQFINPDGTIGLSPNDDFQSDAMASMLARLLNVIVTSPRGTAATFGGWWDRYGLENADKCVGKFGVTYPASNGSPANIRLGQRDYLLQQNWQIYRHGGGCVSSYQYQ